MRRYNLRGWLIYVAVLRTRQCEFELSSLEIMVDFLFFLIEMCHFTAESTTCCFHKQENTAFRTVVAYSRCVLFLLYGKPFIPENCNFVRAVNFSQATRHVACQVLVFSGGIVGIILKLNKITDHGLINLYEIM